MSDKWSLQRIQDKMDWEGMPSAIEWIHWEDIEDPELAKLWEPMENAYMDYDTAHMNVTDYLSERVE